MHSEQITLIVALLLLASIVAGKASTRLGIPALLGFLLIGMLAGSEGPGKIPFDNPGIAELVGVMALSLILFAGGADTEWASIRSIVREGMLLSTAGVTTTACLIALFARYVFGWPFPEGLLLGAIVSSTDAAAVFGTFRAKRLALPQRLRSLLEFESGSNDPFACFLVLALIAFLAHPALRPSYFAVMLVRQVVVGGAVGYGIGKLMTLAVNRVRLDYEGLYPVLTVAFVLLAYGLSSIAGGNGFLAVYLAGIIFGNSEHRHKRRVHRFHDGFAWLMQIILFLTLGLQVFPSRLAAVAGPALLVAIFLMFVARPAPVVALLTGSKFAWNERFVAAWAGLRGAAPIVLATIPAHAGVTNAQRIFDVVFFVVLLSALVQGVSIGWLSVRLGLRADSTQQPHEPQRIEAPAA